MISREFQISHPHPLVLVIHARSAAAAVRYLGHERRHERRYDDDDSVRGRRGGADQPKLVAEDPASTCRRSRGKLFGKDSLSANGPSCYRCSNVSGPELVSTIECMNYQERAMKSTFLTPEGPFRGGLRSSLLSSLRRPLSTPALTLETLLDMVETLETGIFSGSGQYCKTDVEVDHDVDEEEKRKKEEEEEEEEEGGGGNRLGKRPVARLFVLPIRKEQKGALTLGLNQAKGHTVQAAIRMRQLGTTQCLRLSRRQLGFCGIKSIPEPERI